MCSWASIITSVLGFREEMSQNMTRVGCCGPIQSLVCIIGHAGEGLGILRKEPAPAQPADKVFPVCFCQMRCPRKKKKKKGGGRRGGGRREGGRRGGRKR